MNKREKTMLFIILGIVFLFGHFFGVKKYMSIFRQKGNESTILAQKVVNYKNSESNAKLIESEIDWLQKYEPKPSTFDIEQDKLLGLLQKTAETHNFSTNKPKLLKMEDSGGKYQRTKIEMRATATESQIYNWLVDVHEPTKFRAITQIIIQPTSKVDDDGLIQCVVIAEQWFINSPAESS